MRRPCHPRPAPRAGPRGPAPPRIATPRRGSPSDLPEASREVRESRPVRARSFPASFREKALHEVHHLRFGHGERVSASRATDKRASFAHGTPGPACAVVRIDLPLAQRASDLLFVLRRIQNVIPAQREKMLTAAPTRTANWKMNRDIPIATFTPCSLTITRRFARHGIKSVIVTRLTTTWRWESIPAFAMLYSPAAP